MKKEREIILELNKKKEEKRRIKIIRTSPSATLRKINKRNREQNVDQQNRREQYKRIQDQEQI